MLKDPLDPLLGEKWRESRAINGTERCKEVRDGGVSATEENKTDTIGEKTDTVQRETKGNISVNRNSILGASIRSYSRNRVLRIRLMNAIISV